MNLSTEKKNHGHGEQTSGCQGGGGAEGGGGRSGMDWEFGISRCKLLHLEWKSNESLLYSTGNYVHYPVINHNGKEYEKEHI